MNFTIGNSNHSLTLIKILGPKQESKPSKCVYVLYMCGAAVLYMTNTPVDNLKWPDVVPALKDDVSRRNTTPILCRSVASKRAILKSSKIPNCTVDNLRG